MDRPRRRSDCRRRQRLLVAPADNTATPVELHKGSERLDAPAISPDGARVAFQMMPRDDWEIFVIGRDGTDETRVTREIQHDVLPQFLGDTRCSRMIGEPRHRRSYRLRPRPSGDRARALFHNNTVRTIAPEYAWVAERRRQQAADRRRARRRHRLARARRLPDRSRDEGHALQDLRARVAADLKAERALRAQGQRLFAPIAADVADVSSAKRRPAASTRYEKALFDFDSKHITQPGNKLASEYLFNTYKSFGYDAGVPVVLAAQRARRPDRQRRRHAERHGQPRARLRRQQPLRLGRRRARAPTTTRRARRRCWKRRASLAGHPHAGDDHLRVVHRRRGRAARQPRVRAARGRRTS